MSWAKAIVFPQRLQNVTVENSGPAPIGGQALQETLAKSYQAGFQAASSECNAKMLEMRQQMQSHANGILNQLESAHRQLIATISEQLPDMITHGVWKIVGQQAMPIEVMRARIEHIVKENCPAEEPVEVSLHPTDLAELQNIDANFTSQHPLFQFKSDDKLSRGDCVMETKFGKVDATLNTQMARMVMELSNT